jgi:hypothetical protein
MSDILIFFIGFFVALAIAAFSTWVIFTLEETRD